MNDMAAQERARVRHARSVLNLYFISQVSEEASGGAADTPSRRDGRAIGGHYRKIDRVAAVPAIIFLQIAPRIAPHFAHPEIRVFASSERTKAFE